MHVVRDSQPLILLFSYYGENIFLRRENICRGSFFKDLNVGMSYQYFSFFFIVLVRVKHEPTR